MTIVLPALTAGAATGCSVKNKATGRTYPTLQRAVNAARPLQTLLVRGTCRGKTIIRKDLTIRGAKTTRWGAPRLRANPRRLVLTIRRGARVTVRSLVILDSTGVLNEGTATLIDVQIRGRGNARIAIRNIGKMWLVGASMVRQTTGIVNRGRLILSGDARIRGNECGGDGVDNCPGVTNSGTLVMNDRSSLSGSGGSGAANSGTMVMNDHARIHGNSVDAAGECWAARGGGVHNTGRLVMRGHSAIVGNTLVSGDDCSSPDWRPGDAQGGGVYNTGSLIMRGQARIADNGPANTRTEVRGGGVYNAKGGTLSGALCGGTLANVYANTPDDCYFEE